MAKNEKRTLNVILDELNNAVEVYNGLELADVARADWTKKAKELVTEYNELSMLTVYCNCLDAKLPVKAFVEAFNYPVVSIKDSSHPEVGEDGCKHLVFSRAVNDEGTKALHLVKFLEWAAEKNKQIAASKDWRVKIGAAKDTIKAEWKKFHGANKDSHSVSIKKLKAAMQDMFDALIFIPTEKGENSVIATGDIAKLAWQFANKTNTNSEKNTHIGDVLPDREWNTIMMKTLLSAVTGKKLIVNFDGEPTEEEAKANAEATPETK